MTGLFSDFMSQLKETNARVSTFTDFDKVSNNVEKIAMKLNQLNYLLGKNDIEAAIKSLYNENPASFSVLPILVAVRDNKKVITPDSKIVTLNDYLTSYDGICRYFKESGLAEIFCSMRITNLVDYVFGIEVGLDTNARKNRGGTIMESDVAKIFNDNNITFREQVSIKEFPEIISLGNDEKRFDFVIESRGITYLIETNFYNEGGGSKLNETARSYTDIAPKIDQYPKYKFVWVTDGIGWRSAKNKLEQAFNTITYVYNLTSISNFIKLIK